MKLSFKHLLFICISFFFYSVSLAQLSDTSKVISLSAQELYFNRSDNEEKMSSDLFYKVVHFLKETYKGQSVQKVITELKKDEFSTFDDQNRLLVFIRLKSNSKSDETQLVNLINNSGGEVYHQEVGHNNLSEITAYLPIQAIIKIVENEKTALIKKPIPILFHTYTSAGDEQLKAQQVRQLFNVDGSIFNVDGSKIKIGVISDGADKWFQAYAANELPMISIIRNGSGDEGTAMMEIIHDLAPSSELIFAGVKGLLYPVNWPFVAGLVNELHYTRGCQIIVDDFYSPEEPFFSDEGLFGEAIRNFINNGGVYITAAGNHRESLYSGITALGSGYHVFPDGKDYLEFVLEGSDWLYLQWSTRWTNPSIDLDFEALNTTTNTTYYSSYNQSYTTPPIENIDLTEPGVYRLKVKKRAGLESVEFKILSVRNNNISNNNTKQIFGHSAYPNVISVAAYQANNQNTTSDYNSIGPALMYSTAIQDWTVQEVPTITATSGVETWVGSTGLWSGGYPVFDGTSASAPHIAGLAALYFHKLNGIENLNKSNMDFRNDLTLSATTLEIGTGGIWNNKSGFGKANILEAIIRNLTSVERVATPVFNPPGGGFNSAQNIEITCSTPGPDVFIYYTDDGSEPNQSSTLYTGQFEISNNVVLKAKAFKEGLIESFTAAEAYQIYQDIYPITINQLDYSNSPFGEFDYWFQNQWINKPTGTTLHFSFQHTLYLRLKFLQDFKEGTTQKFHFSRDAGNIYLRNNDNVYFPADGDYVNGHFRPSYTATIVNALEGFETVYGGTLEFKDPWLVDVNDPQNRFYFHPYGNGNLGMLVPWMEENGIINAVPNEQSKYKGVFLGLTPSLNRGIYNLRVPQNFSAIVHGKIRQFKFQNWSTENATVLDPNNFMNDKYETRLVFNSVNAIVQANYKGQGLSNEHNAYSNSSQRKFVKTSNGDLHYVYSSLGHIWYERSTDGGNTWTIANGGNYLDNGEGKLPSIDENGYDNFVVIAYQERNGNNFRIKIKIFENGIQKEEEHIYSVGQSYDFNANPVVAYTNSTSSNDKFIVIFQTNQGLYYRYGLINIDEEVIWPEPPQDGIINGTNQHSTNPTIAAKKNVGAQGDFYLAWQQYDTQILYKQIHFINNEITSDPTPALYSYNSGFTKNYSPSISLAVSNPVVSWVGHNGSVSEKMVLKGNGGEPLEETKIVVKRGTSGNFFVAGNNVNNVNNNSTSTGGENTVVTWSENNPAVSKWVKRTGTSFSPTVSLSNSGIQSQVSNGTNYSGMKAMVFNNQTTPFNFKLATSDFSQNFDIEVDKITTDGNYLTYGRTGITGKNGVQFIFNVGDIILADTNVQFIDIPDTLVYTSTEELNEVTRSLDFHLTNQSQLYFTNYYYVVNPELADSVLTSTDEVSFRVELVNSNNNEVVGTFDNITYTKNNLENYDNISYQVDCSGIQTGNYFIRLVTNVSGEASYNLANVQNDNPELEKKHYNQVNFTGSELPVTYELFQNFPNPFNPTTSIRYQVPEDGIVSLKIYDILGKEVTTLVNEQKAVGKYQLNFDATDLASGVYIYRIQVNDFVSAKKMMLVK